MAKIQWSARLTNTTNYKLDSNIMTAEIRTSEFNKEVNRVFEIARKRLARIDQAGLFSPAALAVKDANFYMQGNNFFDLKNQYAKAIEFLKQPTSTLEGLKSYNKTLMQEYDIPEKEFKEMSKRLRENNRSFQHNDYIDWFFMQYKNFLEEIENAAQGIENEIETEAQKTVEQLDKEIERELQNSEELKKQITEVIQRSLTDLLNNAFK